MGNICALAIDAVTQQRIFATGPKSAVNHVLEVVRFDIGPRAEKYVALTSVSDFVLIRDYVEQVSAPRRGIA